MAIPLVEIEKGEIFLAAARAGSAHRQELAERQRRPAPRSAMGGSPTAHSFLLNFAPLIRFFFFPFSRPSLACPGRRVGACRRGAAWVLDGRDHSVISISSLLIMDPTMEKNPTKVIQER